MSPDDGSYDEGERVFGPPQGSYDADWVAQTARTADPSLDEVTARELAVDAWTHLREVKELDAPEIARRLLAGHRDAGASAANFVAKAAVEFCATHEVEL